LKVTKFLRSFLSAESIKDPQTVTISGVKLQEIGKEGEREEKLVMSFKELDQGLVLSKTILTFLIEATGTDETDLWIGKKFVLYLDPKVTFGGKRVGGIRLRSAD